jgi:hypothetical protein
LNVACEKLEKSEGESPQIFEKAIEFIRFSPTVAIMEKRKKPCFL